MLTYQGETETPREAVVDRPVITRITAPLIDDLSFSRKHAQSRNKDLRANQPTSNAARTAMQRLSDTPMSTATTLTAVDAAQSVRREVRSDSRSFHFSNKRRRQAKTQKLRTSRTYATLAAKQRRQVKSEVKREIRKMVDANNTRQIGETEGDFHSTKQEEHNNIEDTITNSGDKGNLRMPLTCSATLLWLWSITQHLLV